MVAVVVTRNPGPWLEDTLAGLERQDYDDLTVLVVDCGSDDDPTPRVAAVLPRAFVRRLDDRAGFAGAANEALHAVEGATFLLLCHDDVVLDPAAVRLLVEEAYRSNAGIVGPKLVSADDPEILLEVGRSIDRFGAPYTGIEPGELDQEQHDGVRDVFYVTTATMLVRVDLFAELGGFDPATFPGAEDLDLCWRARLAGARVLVGPDARVAHREAADERMRGDRPDEFALARSRAGAAHVVLVAQAPVAGPVRVRGRLHRGVGDLLTGRPRRARAAIGAGSPTSSTSAACARRAGAPSGSDACTTASCASCRWRAPRGSACSCRTTCTPTTGCARWATPLGVRSTACPTVCARRRRSRSSASSCWW